MKSLVEVADKPGGGERFTYISSTVFTGSGETDVDDTTPGGSDGAEIPLPAAGWMMLAGIGALAMRRRRRG
jgi:hypothetical protein